MSRRTSANIFGKVIAYILTFVLIGVAVVSTVCLFNNDFRKQVKETIGIEETVESSDNSNSTTSDVKDSEEYLLIVEELESQKKATAEAESQLLTIQIEKTELQQNLTKAEEDLAIAENTVLEKTTQIENLTAEKTQLVNELATAEEELEQLKNASGDTAELQDRINELESEVAEKTSALETKTSELETKTNELETAQAEVLSLTTEKSSLETQLAEKQTTIDSLNTQIETLNARIIELEEELANAGSGTSGDYEVRLIDYDGSILDTQYLNSGDVYSLPEFPTHDRLVAQEYVATTDITDNTVTVTDSDIDIGITYTTASGLSEFDITLTKATGLSVTLNVTDGTINWGDGSSETVTTSISHTYADYGNYTITWSGTTMSTSSNVGLFNQSTSSVNGYVTSIRLANITNIEQYAFWRCYSLENVTCSNKLTDIKDNAFYYCYSLENVTLPNSVTSIGKYAFGNCSSLVRVATLNSVTSINSSAFYNCYLLTGILNLKNVTSINSYAFGNCYSLTDIRILGEITELTNQSFRNCVSLKNITLSSSITKIGENCFSGCESITSIKIPANVTTILTYAFSTCHSIICYDMTTLTTVPTLGGTNAFNDINKICRIYVPDELYDEWIVASNWSTYADYIYKASEMPA